MAKYLVNFSCGHTEEVQLFGKGSDRERKIEYFGKAGTCSACYRMKKEIENSIGCIEIEMLYKEYKTNYADCKTKEGSWNPATKSIVVYVPEEV